MFQGVSRQPQIIQADIFSCIEKVHKFCFPGFTSGSLIYQAVLESFTMWQNKKKKKYKEKKKDKGKKNIGCDTFKYSW